MRIFKARHILRRLFDHEYSWQRIMLLALIVRVVLLVLFGDTPLEGDALQYHDAALQLLGGEGPDTYWPPGLPLYECLWILAFGKSVLVARISAIPWFLMLCRSFYGMAYQLHSRMAANLGLAVLAFFPAFVHQSIEPLSYLPAAALLMGLFGQLQQYLQDKKGRRITRGGILLGLLILFRPSALLYLLTLPAMIMVRRKKFMPSFIFGSIALGIVFSWVYFASDWSGHRVIVNDANSRNFYLGNNEWTPSYKTWYFGSHWTGHPDLPLGFRNEIDSLDQLPADDRGKAYSKAAWQNIKKRPLEFGWRTFSRARTLMAFDSFAGTRLLSANDKRGYIVLGLDAFFYCMVVILAMLFWFTKAQREFAGRHAALMSLFLFTYAIPYLIAFSHPSYHLPMLPILLLAAVVWLQNFFTKGVGIAFPSWRKGKGWKAWLLILLFICIQIEWLIRMTNSTF